MNAIGPETMNESLGALLFCHGLPAVLRLLADHLSEPKWESLFHIRQSPNVAPYAIVRAGENEHAAAELRALADRLPERVGECAGPLTEEQMQDYAALPQAWQDWCSLAAVVGRGGRLVSGRPGYPVHPRWGAIRRVYGSDWSERFHADAERWRDTRPQADSAEG